MLTSKPPLVAISVGRRQGKTVKHTGKNILASKEFVIHIVDDSFIEQVNESSAEYPAHVSEVEITGLTLTESKKISVPGIKEAKVRLECRLHQTVPLGNDEEYSTDLFIGEVVMFHIADDLYEKGHVNAEKLGAVSRLGGAEYAKVTDIFSLARPDYHK